MKLPLMWSSMRDSRSARPRPSWPSSLLPQQYARLCAMWLIMHAYALTPADRPDVVVVVVVVVVVIVDVRVVAGVGEALAAAVDGDATVAMGRAAARNCLHWLVRQLRLGDDGHHTSSRQTSCWK
jgi:hypothetical protein